MKNVVTLAALVGVLAVGGAAMASDVDNEWDGAKQFRVDWGCTIKGEDHDCRGFSKQIRADEETEVLGKFDVWFQKNHTGSRYTNARVIPQ